MGHLLYGGSQEYEFEDRTLAHLKVAITMKLRRQESFLLSWVNPAEKGGGRVSLWLAPSIPLAFRFAGSRTPALSREWLEVLNELSHSTRGLIVISEQEAQKHLAAQASSNSAMTNQAAPKSAAPKPTEKG